MRREYGSILILFFSSSTRIILSFGITVFGNAVDKLIHCCLSTYLPTPQSQSHLHDYIHQNPTAYQVTNNLTHHPTISQHRFYTILNPHSTISTPSHPQTNISIYLPRSLLTFNKILLPPKISSVLIPSVLGFVRFSSPLSSTNPVHLLPNLLIFWILDTFIMVQRRRP